MDRLRGRGQALWCLPESRAAVAAATAAKGEGTADTAAAEGWRDGRLGRHHARDDAARLSRKMQPRLAALEDHRVIIATRGQEGQLGDEGPRARGPKQRRKRTLGQPVNHGSEILLELLAAGLVLAESHLPSQAGGENFQAQRHRMIERQDGARTSTTLRLVEPK